MRWSIFIVLLLSLLNPVSISAGIYQCIKSDGNQEFRDTPCQSSLETQSFLPLPYGKTDPKLLKKQESELEKSNRQLTSLQKKKDRVQQKKVKQLSQENNKEAHRQTRCLQIQEKINLLESQLRQGCKLKKSIRLQTQIEQAERLKQRFCVAGL